jgi:high-affinity nickel permease
MEPLAVIALGFVLGVRHATDPDHVVAVTAIAARSRRIAPARSSACCGASATR